MIRRIIEGITNTFENGTPEYAYGKCEHLDDGRGYTCGRIGFTTGTGDALWVVERYVQQRGSNNTALARYLPELRRLAALPNCDMNGKESIQHLEGFPAAWTMADQQDTKLFRHIQDSINEEHYLVPALKFAHKHGVTTPLGQAIFYDTVVQHGYAVTEDNIDLQRVITLTGARHVNETETQWLDRFLVTRGQMLCCFPDSVWPASADRVHDLRELLRRGQLNLKGNITLGSSGIQILATADNSTTPSEDLRASAIKIRRLPSHSRNTSRKMALLPSRGHRRLSSTSKHT
ncbi:lysozyme-like domain-containing protein [Syncephalis plumigaleata]|nr:lysozyme-like domain-containing protein [Syncephalis plumigaleata]